MDQVREGRSRGPGRARAALALAATFASCCVAVPAGKAPEAAAGVQGGAARPRAKAPVAEAVPESPAGPAPREASPVGSSSLQEGDRIRLVFYERLDSEDDRWRGARGAVPRGFHQRAEVSGEYAVADDGSVSLPMLGRFPAAGLAPDAFAASLVAPFEALVERKGFVSAVSVERQPVYVVGPVKNPGSFAFEPGMTALHAVALAGGIKAQDAETWQRVEFGREVDRLQRSLDRAKRLVARTAVLQAERDGAAVRQKELAGLMGKAQSSTLVGEEAWQRNLTTMSRSAQEAALVAAVANAKGEVAARGDRLEPLDASIKLRTERLRSLTGLSDRNVIGRPVVIQAQAELTDAEDRRHQAQLEAEVSRRRLDTAERELSKFRIEAKVEVDRSASAAQRDASDAIDEGQGLLDVVKALAGSGNAAGADGGVTYEIVRRVKGNAVVIPSAETATLRPGDLVRLRRAEPAAVPQPGDSAGQARAVASNAVRSRQD